MQQQPFDPGLTQQYGGNLRRSINADGSFNVHRKGQRLRDANIYLYLVHLSWSRFFGLVVLAYFIVNLAFAGLYLALGIENLRGADRSSQAAEFQAAFFFSVHTLTTVGYGNIAPIGFWTNLTAAVEAMFGLMGFAIGTGLLYGRFSRPSARILFSERMIVAPYQDVTALEFRIANGRSNHLMELDATMLFMTVDNADGQLKRSFAQLTLERTHVYFFPLTWTVVHPIVPGSPLYGKTADDLARAQAEVMILIKGFDETFSQTVHARFSYRFDEIEWGARFMPAFEVNPEGDLILDLERLSAREPAPLPYLAATASGGDESRVP